MPAAPTITSLQTVLAGLAGGSPSGSLTGTKKSGPTGIESIIEYRSKSPVYLNVADWVDTFLVITINGLDSADLRASATPNPGEHGETPNDALWGGRTLVLVGKQFAHTIWKLRDMQQGLRASFLEIKTEYPLIFHAADPANDLMIMCRLADKINIPDQQTTRNEYQRDFQIPLRASNPRFLSVIRQIAAMTDLSSVVMFTTDNVPTVENFTLPAGLLSSYTAQGDGFTQGSDYLIQADTLRNMITNPRGDGASGPLQAVSGNYDWDVGPGTGVGNITVQAAGGPYILTVNSPAYEMTVAGSASRVQGEIEFQTVGGALGSPVSGGEKLRITGWITFPTTPAPEVAVGVAVRWWIYPQVAGPVRVLAPVPLTDAGYVLPAQAWSNSGWYRIDTTITVPSQAGVNAFPAPLIYFQCPNGNKIATTFKVRVSEPMLDLDRGPTRGASYGDGTFVGWMYEGQAKNSISRRRMTVANMLSNTRAYLLNPPDIGVAQVSFGGIQDWGRIQDATPANMNNYVAHDTWWYLESNGAGQAGAAVPVPPADELRKPMTFNSGSVRVAEKTPYSFSFYVRAATVPRRIYVRFVFGGTGNGVVLPDAVRLVTSVPAQVHGADGKDAVGEWRRFWADVTTPAGAVEAFAQIYFSTDDVNPIPAGERHYVSAVMFRGGAGPRPYIDGSGTVMGTRPTPDYTWAGTAWASPTLGPWGTRNLLADSDNNKPDTTTYTPVSSTLVKVSSGGAGGAGGAFVRATYDATSGGTSMGLSNNAFVAERVQHTVMAHVKIPQGKIGGRKVALDVWWYQDTVTPATKLGAATSPDFFISNDWTQIKMENVIVPDKATIAALRVVLRDPMPGDQLDIDRMAVINLPTAASWFGMNAEFTRPADPASSYGEAFRYNYTVAQTSRNFTECQQTVKLLLPLTNTGVDDMVHLTVAYVDDDNQIYVTLENPNVLAIIRRDLGVVTTLATMTVADQLNNAPYYVRARLSDGVVFAESATYDLDAPPAGSVAPNALKVTLADNDTLKYQDVLLPMRVGIQAVGGNWIVDEWRYYSLTEPQGWNVYRGKGTITVKGSRLAPLNKDEKLLTRAGLTYKVADAKISAKLRYETQPTAAEGSFDGGVAAKVLDKDNFIAATILGKAVGTAGLVSMNLYKVDNGVRSNLDIGQLGSFAVATDNWVRIVMVGNSITAERWTTDPALGGAPYDTVTNVLAGADAAKFGAGVKGEFGIYWPNPQPVGVCSIDDFSFTLANFDDIAYSIRNNGNFEAQTTISLTGPMTNPRVTNEANNTSFLINGTIPTGEVWVLENDGPSKRMYRKSDGANRFSYLDATSMWIMLEPNGVPNNIRLTATALAAGWDMGVQWRHTYM